MRQIHGIADAKKIMMIGETDDIEVKIVDDINQRVILMTAERASSLTTEQARWLAKCLLDSALRAEKAK